MYGLEVMTHNIAAVVALMLRRSCGTCRHSIRFAALEVIRIEHTHLQTQLFHPNSQAGQPPFLPAAGNDADDDDQGNETDGDDDGN